MKKGFINQIKCANCKKYFDVCTEDLEWERITCDDFDKENPEGNPCGILQEISCPYCQHPNQMAVQCHAVNDANDIRVDKVISLEKDILMEDIDKK